MQQAPAAQLVSMARRMHFHVILLCLAHLGSAEAQSEDASCDPCEVQVSTDAGPACGLRRRTSSGFEYASFLGLPYAKQPRGSLRFKELQKAEPWSTVYYATKEGPICPQHDLLYKGLMTNKEMDEGCIHANVHIPIQALPSCKTRRSRDIETPFHIGRREEESAANPGLPIFVFVHGGGFSYGSGDTDLHGPEYLVNEGVIVVSFNYRLGVFGFLSLESEELPGNGGLRDVVALLRWVRAHAGRFGGDAARVTLAGHSAGAAIVHLLTLSKAATGLFQRAILMSGVGIRSFFTTSPLYSAMLKGMLLKYMNITATDPKAIHDELIEMPLDTIQIAYRNILDFTGLVGFAPVVESKHSGIVILDKEPELLIEEGRADNIPLLVGMTSAECEVFRPRYEECKIFERFKNYSPTVLSPVIIFTNTINDTFIKADKIAKHYFKDSIEYNKLVSLTSDAYFKYPAIKLAEIMTSRDVEVYLYKFSYQSPRSVIKEALEIEYEGATHIEDLTYLFKTNSIEKEEGFNKKDNEVRRHFTRLITHFINNGNPNYDPKEPWSRLAETSLQYQLIDSGSFSPMKRLTDEETNMMWLFDDIFKNKSH